RAAGGFALTGALGDPPAVRASAEAPSLSEAIDAVLKPVIEAIGAGQPVLPPDDAERAEMEQLGTRSLEAYRLYQRVLDQTFGTILIDAPRVEALIEEMLRFDPGWAHGYALLASVRGAGSS